MNKEFTQDWFSNNTPKWSVILDRFKDKPDLNFLEIGCFEGRATCWLCDNILTNPTSKITVLDTFRGGDEHHSLDLSELYNRFKNNTQEYGNKVKILANDSMNEYFRGVLKPNTFDFIYIDGSHNAKDVLLDAVNCFNLLKPGGVMIFDDYLWNPFNDPIKAPQIAIDSFLTCFADQCNIIMKEYQVAIEKK